MEKRTIAMQFDQSIMQHSSTLTDHPNQSVKSSTNHLLTLRVNIIRLDDSTIQNLQTSQSMSVPTQPSSATSPENPGSSVVLPTEKNHNCY